MQWRPPQGGILVPYKKRDRRRSRPAWISSSPTRAAHVSSAARGHENVAELDFASMYPSLMDRYNISPETINCACCGGIRRRTARPPRPGDRHHTCLRAGGSSPIRSPDPRQAPAPEGAAEGGNGGGGARGLPQAADGAEMAPRRLLRVPRLPERPFGRSRRTRRSPHGREKLLSAKEIAERIGSSFSTG